MIEEQSVKIQRLTDEKIREVKELKAENKRQNRMIEYLINNEHDKLQRKTLEFKAEQGQFQNSTLEERVELLEIQVVVIQDEVSDLETDVDFLFGEQIIQDERFFSLEQISIDVDDALEGLQATTLALDFRVTVLEETGGSDGNSSVAELEVRVETLEGTAADHEMRISVTESDVNDLDEAVANQETRLTATEENIQELQMTYVELDARITALEENGGGGSTQNVTIGFHTVLTSYSSITVSSPVIFNQVLVNEGYGYDSTTGTFTVPPGGDGFYYFSVYLLVEDGERGRFAIRVNSAIACYAHAEQKGTTTDEINTSCNAIVSATEGDSVQVVYTLGDDTTPIYSGYYTGFTGFRI